MTAVTWRPKKWAVLRRMKKRAVMRRRGLTTVEEMGSGANGHQNYINFTCDLFDILLLLLFVSPNTNSEALNCTKLKVEIINFWISEVSF